MEPELMFIDSIKSMERELAWFGHHTKDLEAKYDEQFVAIKDEKVIAAGRNFEPLLKKIKQEGFDPADVLIEFVSKIKRIL